MMEIISSLHAFISQLDYLVLFNENNIVWMAEAFAMIQGFIEKQIIPGKKEACWRFCAHENLQTHIKLQ